MHAEVNGARLHYERRGAGEPLLWITGFAISAAVFDPVLGLYERRFDNILYDNRGAGRSKGPRRLTSMAELAADAAGLLDRLGLDSAHVHGVSMGGMVAQELALRFPERVRGLILGGTTPGGPLAARPALGELAALGAGLARGARAPGRPWLAAALFSPEFRRRHPDRVRDLLVHFRAHRPPLDGLAAHWWASVYHDTVARLPRIGAPTLVLHGAHDALAPLANAELLAARIPDAELAVVPDAGHAYLLERPEAAFALLRDWLDRRGDIPPGRSRSGWTARYEPLTRRVGLPIAAARTGVSLARLARERAKPRREEIGSCGA